MIDHIVVATSDLEATRRWLSETTGIEGNAGGVNPVNATQNVLYALAEVGYLELLAAYEPGRAAAERPLPFGLESLSGIRVAAWAAQVHGLEAVIAGAEPAAVPLGPVVAMSRTRPDGVRLEWTMTYPVDGELESLCPFLIDWGESEHPSVTLRAAGTPLRLTRFSLASRQPAQVKAWLDALGVAGDAIVEAGDGCRLIVAVEGPAGTALIPGSMPIPPGL
jgi:catechol 2,3-dioxygenase-like lactoylglutathione lyase family enzyme